MRELAARIDRKSTEAFRLGLMNVDDFGIHQEMVFRFRTAAAGKGLTDADRRAMLTARIRRFDRAAERLKNLNQPGAAGWSAEVVHARLMSTNGRIELALARKDRATASIFAKQSQALSRRFYELRKRDYAVGLASDQQMSKAVSESLGPGKVRAAGVTSLLPALLLRDALARQVRRKKRTPVRPGGNARPDELHWARSLLAESEAHVALAAGHKSRAASALLRADLEAQRQFQRLQQFSKKGTASLFDMTRAWLRRDSLQRLMLRERLALPEDAVRARRRNLDALVSLMQRTKDHRGRNAADAALVRALQMLESARPLRASRLGKVHSAQTGSIVPRVYDLKPRAKTESKVQTPVKPLKQ